MIKINIFLNLFLFLFILNVHSYSNIFSPQSFLQVKQENKTSDTTNQDQKDEVVELVKKQNKILMDEIELNKRRVTENMNKSFTDFNNTLNYTHGNLSLDIERSQYKINESLNVIDSQINEINKQNDDVASMMLQKEIIEKEKKLEILDKEIQDLNSSIPYDIEDSDKISKCQSKSSCKSCVEDDGCVWCTLSNKCVEGDEFGPLYEITSFFNYKKCNGNNCGEYSNCKVYFFL